jgi:DNA repair exonuclease SbcCD nuclease subunit
MKILFTADWHIKLGQPKVPKEFQKNRFIMLAHALKDIYIEHGCDLHIIGGDILDVADPSTDELQLMYKCLEILEDQQGIIYTGNHEMKSKSISCLDHLAANIANSTKHNWTVEVVNRTPEYDINDYRIIHKSTMKPALSKLCFTHVRGNIEPHVSFEVDPKIFKDYELVICGDLHSYQNTQVVDGIQFAYPGSPLTTSFHRHRTKNTNGCFIIDTDSLSYTWIELGHLPQLLRKTVTSSEEMVADEYDRVIYEVEGNVEELRSIKDSELLDKRLNTKITKDAVLDLSGLNTSEELAIFLQEVQGLDTETITRLVSTARKYTNV